MIIRIRPAARDDLPAVEAICSGDPDDYVPEEFLRWVDDPAHYTFVVELDGRPAGVADATMLSDWEAWGQGVRVHPAFRRRGVGRAITGHWPAVMRERGARAAMIATNARNLPSIRMHGACGFATVAHTDVRRWRGQALRRPPALPPVRRADDAGEVWRRVQASPALAAHAHIVRTEWRFRHATRADVARFVKRRRALTAGDAFACYLTRPSWDDASTIAAIVAADGQAEEIQAIALHLVDRAAGEGWSRVVFDGRKDTAPVEAVAAIGFEPPEDWGEMLVMQKALERAGAP